MQTQAMLYSLGLGSGFSLSSTLIMLRTLPTRASPLSKRPSSCTILCLWLQPLYTLGALSMLVGRKNGLQGYLHQTPCNLYILYVT